MKYKEFAYAFLSVIFITLICNVTAQVPVRDEPHHKVVLENEFVRLIDVHIMPHDTTLIHVHAAPSVIVFLSKSSIGTQIVGESAVSSSVNPGQTSYASYDEKSIKHRVWNAGESVFHVMDIEMVKKEPSPDTCAILSQNGSTVEIQRKLVRVYKMDVVAGRKYTIQKSTCAHLLIDITGVVISTTSSTRHSLNAGMFTFFSPQSEFEIIGAKENAQCVLLEMK